MKDERKLRTLLEENPIIASVNSDETLDIAVASECGIVFVLYGNLCTIGSIVKKLKNAGKVVFVHADLLEGSSAKDVVVDFIHDVTQADGIISAKNNLLRTANSRDMYTIHRFFLVDSMSLSNITKQLQSSGADIVEIMPGYGPVGIQWVLRDLEAQEIDKPLIASGLVCSKEAIVNALSVGASAISTTCVDIWDRV